MICLGLLLFGSDAFESLRLDAPAAHLERALAFAGQDVSAVRVVAVEEHDVAVGDGKRRAIGAQDLVGEFDFAGRMRKHNGVAFFEAALDPSENRGGVKRSRLLACDESSPARNDAHVDDRIGLVVHFGEGGRCNDKCADVVDRFAIFHFPLRSFGRHDCGDQEKNNCDA